MMAAISEAQRRVMYMALVAEFGEEVGDTIMAHLPPVGWADVATKGDLVHLKDTLSDRFTADIERAVSKLTLRVASWNSVTLLAIAGLAFGDRFLT